jgi:integrase
MDRKVKNGLMTLTYKNGGRAYYSDLRMDVWDQDVGRYVKRRLHRFLSKDKVRAEVKLLELKQKREMVNDDVGANITMGAYCENFLENRKAQVHWKTFNHEKRAIRYFFDAIPYIKNKHMSDCVPKILDQAKTIWMKGGIGHYIINRSLIVMMAIMRKAENDNYIPKFEWNAVKLIKLPNRKLYFYSFDELENLIKKVNGKWLTFVLLGSKAGLRLGEIVNLRKDQILWDQNLIHIIGNDKWNPKAKKERYVPMCKNLRKHLAEISKNIDKEHRFFPYNLNPQRCYDHISDKYTKLLKRRNFCGSAHTLRHTFASHLAIRGISLQRIMEWLGHSDMKMTLRYAHLMPANTTKEIEVLN